MALPTPIGYAAMVRPIGQPTAVLTLVEEGTENAFAIFSQSQLELFKVELRDQLAMSATDDEVRDLLGSSESISREKAEARYRYADIMIAAKI